jgi:CHAT domain-containing protein
MRHIYAFMLSPDSICMKRLALDPDDDIVDKFQQDCANQIQTTKSLKEYINRAHKLYEILVEPFQAASKRLVIVPDGKLCRIPFGNLMTADSPTSKLTPFYLENQKIISYAASLTVWKENLDAPPVKSRTYLALAPIYYGKYGFGSLTHTAAHLDTLKQRMTGKNLKGRDADVQHFDKAIQEDYNMLLLYTHALADSNPRVYLYDSVLYLPEIYARRIRANMAVLGSCESGAGPWQRGEGVMSLGRGFAYAGVPAVATTLWPVNERETLEILKIFYANLLQGQPKDEALANAKRYFLQTNEQSDTKPHLWAGLILMGTPEPLFEKPSGHGALIWTLAVLLALIGGWLLWRHFSK